MKNLAARWSLRWLLPRFTQSPDGFHRLLGEAIRLQFGRITDDQFRATFDDYYRTVDRKTLMDNLEFEAKAKILNRPGGYKLPVTRWGQSTAAERQSRFSLWDRRFGLLGRLGIRSDVLILRDGEQIPPHGHHRVVSGFYVLDGNVGVRHFDRVAPVSNGVQVRKVLDTVMGPGGFTTNSELYHNIHWLAGRAPTSYLFRLTVAGVPGRPFGEQVGTSERVYIDPSGPADQSGLVVAPFIDEAAAKGLKFNP
jgi:hypothetical protein